MDKMERARQLLSKEILNSFIGRITGTGVDRIAGDNPENVLLVGKLMSVNDEDNQNAHSSKTFIESIGVDFYVAAEEIASAEVVLFPQGDFFYRALPNLEEQQDALLKEINNSSTEQYKSFDEIKAAYNENPSRFNTYKVKLTPVYKKVSISEQGARIAFKPYDLLNENREFGSIQKMDPLNEQIEQYLQNLQEEIGRDKEAMVTPILEPTTVAHLLTNEDYNAFLNHYSKKGVERQKENWHIYFDVRVKRIKDLYLVSCYLVNDSVVLYTGSHRSRKADKATIETLFNSGIRIELKNANYCPIELDSFKDDYKYDKTQYALSNNCAVTYNAEENALQTNHLPLYEQYRLKTRDSLAVSFLDLVSDPIATLELVSTEMLAELERWKRNREQRDQELSELAKNKFDDEIQGFRDEMENFKMGIEVLKAYPIVRKSFVKMNQAFFESSKKYSTWRLFQIVFIVSMIPDIVACDKNVMPDDEKANTHLSSMALLYFPTGGGKTEAFLGVLVFNLFFDRYRGKSCGVTSILRYPLRLLSVQQVQRLANILAQAELLRRNDSEISNTAAFSLGYFVGDNNTPNRLSEKAYTRYRDMTQAQLDESRVLEVCPFCRKNTVHLRADLQMRRLVHFCDNEKCSSGGDLPLFIVDEEIYRYLPSAIISTVDKLAVVGCNANFRNLLNGAEYYCPKHGFTSKNRCIEKSCNVDVQDYEKVEMYDPAPTLFIQDELHLIRESLGTYASHYESFIKYYIKNQSKSQRDVKVIGATATISSYQEQVYHLYGRDPIRFPCESPYVDKNFYSEVDYGDLQRQIMGYAPYGKAVVNSVVYSLKYMREAVSEYYNSPKKVLSIPGVELDSTDQAYEILKDYWIFLEYNNVKLDGTNVDGAIKTPVNEELEEEGLIPFKTRAMTGDESFQDVRDVLAEVENSDNVFDGINLITATSMISHGVDAERFNVMFFYGIPGNMAEYIQAYSRTGRRYSSIVVDLIRPSRETDLSYLKNFVNTHKYKDLLVEAVPINRWATKAIDQTMPGVFMGLLLTCYDPELQYSIGSLFFMKNIQKAIKEQLLSKELVQKQLLLSYGCMSEDGNELEIGNQYKEKINSFVNSIFAQILDISWGNENVFDGFKRMNYRIMNNLRDTDSTIRIEMN